MGKRADTEVKGIPSPSRWIMFAKVFVPLCVIVLVAFLGYHLIQGSKAATTQHILWGSWVKANVTMTDVNGNKYTMAGSQNAAFTQQQDRIGRKMDIIHRYGHWPAANEGPSAGENATAMKNTVNSDIAAGHITLYNLSSGNGDTTNDWQRTANGDFDPYLQSLATETDQINGTFYLAWMHEPTTQIHAAGSSATLQAQYRAAFAHVHDYLVSHKQKQNIKFVLILTADNTSSSGDNYGSGFWANGAVDLLGVDGYNWGCTNHTGGVINSPGCSQKNWRSFCSVFDSGDKLAINKGTNWWITEMGLGDDPSAPGMKSGWFTDMQQFLESHQSAGGSQGKCPTAASGALNWSSLRGIVYYQGGVNINAFNIGSSSASLAAYKAVGNDPFFGGSGATHNDPPTVNLTAPAAGATVSGSVTVSATATAFGTAHINNVAFSYKLHSASSWTALTSDSVSPFSTTWNAGSLANGSYDIRAVVTASDGQTGTDIRTVTVSTVPSQPDLVVTSISSAPGNPLLGQAVSFTAVIKNQGGAAVPSGTKFGLAFDIDGTEVNWYAGFSAGLAAGASASLTANSGPGGVRTWAATAGGHTLQATVDDQNKVAESNESNNSRSVTITTLQAPSITLTKPVNNASFSGLTPVTVPMAAQATDDKNVTSVSFQSDSNVLTTINTSGTSVSPTYNWITGTALNGQHVITATVRDNDGLTKTSAAATITVTNNQPPQAPQAPTGLHSPSQTTSSINLAWTASVPGTGGAPASQLVYHVKRDGQVLPTATQAGVISYTDTGLPAGKTISYTVYATDPQGRQSADSAPLTVSTKKLNCTAPPAPAAFTATATSPTSVALSWSAVTAKSPCVIDHYVVQRSSQTITQQPGTTYNVSGLTPSTDYTFTVLAITNDSTPGAGSNASVRTPDVPDTTPPTAPGNVVALPVSSSQINLTWTAATDPESSVKQYHILRDSQEIGVTTNTSFGDTNLSADTTYTYTIVAENGATPSLETSSADAQATTLSSPVPPGGGGGGGNGGGGDTGGGNTGDTGTIPLLQGTTSVGSGSDSGSSTDSAGALTNPDNGSGSSSSQKQGQSSSQPNGKSAVSIVGRLVAGVGGVGLLVGAPLLAFLFLKRNQHPALRGAYVTLTKDKNETPPPAGTTTSAPGQIINPTKPRDTEDL